MSETTKEEKAYHTFRVVALNPPPKPIQDEKTGEPKYTLTTISTTGSIKRYPCTKEVSTKSFRLHRYKHHHFLVRQDIQTGLVVSLNAIDNPERMNGQFEVEDNRTGPEKEYSSDVVFHHLDDGSYVVKSHPSSVSVREIEAMTQMMNNGGKSYSRGDVVNNRKITAVIDSNEGTYLVFGERA